MRSLTLRRPRCAPLFELTTASPPRSATMSSSWSPSFRALIASSTAELLRAIACLTEFSISGCVIRLGTTLAHVGLNVDGDDQPIGKAFLFDLQVKALQLQLLVDRDQALRVEGESQAQEIRQIFGHCLGLFDPLGRDETRDGVERVEQEVRVELEAQRAKLRGMSKRLQPRIRRSRSRMSTA